MKATAILPIAVLALSMAACTNDEMSTATDGKVALKVNASIGTAVTKASGTQWSPGDQIGISTAEGTATSYANVCYEWDGGSFTAPAENAIYFQTPETVAFHAYYPFTGKPGTAVQSLTGVSTDATNQTAENQPLIDFLYASGATASKDAPTVSFTGDHAFAHRMSQITLTFIEGDDMDLDGSWSYTLGGLKLLGTFDPQTGTATADNVTAAPLTINLTEVLPSSGKYTASSLILFPQDAAGIPITVTVDGQDYTATLSVKDGELRPGCNYTWEITVSKTDMRVGDAEIKGWADVNGDGVTATM